MRNIIDPNNWSYPGQLHLRKRGGWILQTQASTWGSRSVYKQKGGSIFLIFIRVTQPTQPGHPSVGRCRVPEMVSAISGKQRRLWSYNLMTLYISVCIYINY